MQWMTNSLQCAIISGLVFLLIQHIIFTNSWLSLFDLIIPFGITASIISIIDIGKVITPAEAVTWSWPSFKQGFLQRGHVSAVLLLTLCLEVYTFLENRFEYGDGWLLASIASMISSTTAGLFCWIIVAIYRGFISQTIDDSHRIIPNQGIRQSLINGWKIGLTCGGIVYLLYIFVSIPVDIFLHVENMGWDTFALFMDLLQNVFLPAIWLGIFVIPLVCLLTGGLAFCRHWVLRLFLWRSGAMPLDIACFLDHASERILLRKVGGGYIFMHRLLLDHFAAKDI